jgi:serine/threonine protein kinase
MRKSFSDAKRGRGEFNTTRRVGAYDAAQGTNYILRAWECPPHDGYAYAFMTELGSGDLATYMANHTRAANARLMPALINILSTCHSAGFFHGDVKPENFIMVKDEPKLGDFGLSDHLNAGGFKLSGTPGYRFLWHRLDTVGLAAAADWWSLAVIFAEIWIGRKVFTITDLTDLSPSSTPPICLKYFLAANSLSDLDDVITRDLRAVSIPDMKKKLLAFGNKAQQELAKKRRCDDISPGVAPPPAPPAPKRSKTVKRNLRRKALRARLRQEAGAEAANPTPRTGLQLA